MAVFRGVDQQQIHDSIDEALDFLTRLSLCPQVVDLAEQWYQITDVLDRVITARDDRELLEAMAETEAVSFFHRFEELFRSQALMNHGKAFGLYRKLAAWGAFDGQPDTVRRETVDDEIQGFVVCSYVNNLKPEDLRPGSLTYSRLKKAVYDLQDAARQGNIPFAPGDFVEEDFQAVIELLHEALQEHKDYRKAIDMAGNDLESQFRNFLRYILREMNDIHTNGVLLEDFSPFRTYRLSLPADRDVDEDFLLQAATGTAQALAPFARAGDVLSCRSIAAAEGGVLSSWVEFTATRPAAQAVANAFPHQTVESSRGEVIPPEPPRRLLPGPKGPSPAP